jgi:predicted ATPase
VALLSETSNPPVPPAVPQRVARLAVIRIDRNFSHALLASVVCKPKAELGSGLDRLIRAGLLYREGVPPHATYLFKHALVQDAAYGTLLREPRRALHARIAKTPRKSVRGDHREPARAFGRTLHAGRAD